MATTGLCNSYKQELINGGVHTSADTYKVALYTSAATITTDTTVYTATNEVVGTGYTAGGIALSGFAVSQVADSTKVDFNDVSWTGTMTARKAMIYNSSKGNKAVLVFDFGSDSGVINGTFSLPMAPGVWAING